MRAITGRSLCLLLLPLLVLVSGCDSILGPDDDPALLEITGSRTTLDLIGDTVQLSAVVKTEDGKVLDGARVSWTSRTPAVGAVSESGVVMGHANGSAWIIAVSGAAKDSLKVTVASPIDCAPVGDLAVPDTLSGALEEQDCLFEERFTDVWKLTIPTTMQVTLQLESDAFDALLVLVDSRGDIVAWDDDSGGEYNSRLTIDLPAGQYFAHVTSYMPGETGPYRVMAQEGVPPSPCPATAVVGLPDTVTGVTEAGGCELNGFYLDVWRIVVPADTVVVLQVASDDYQAAVVVADTFGYFMDGSGTGPGSSAWLETYLHAGSYDIWLGALDDVSAAGSYTLSTSFGPTLLTCESVGTIDFPGTVTGDLTDTDCYLGVGLGDPWDLELTDSTQVLFSLTSDAQWPHILVLDSLGGFREVFYADGGYVEGEASLAAGRYRVWAITDGTESSSYTLSASTAGQLISCDADGEVAVGDSVSGALSATDCQLPGGRYADVWTARLDTASTVQVSVRSDKFDAYLFVSDSTGTAIAWDDDGGGNGNAALVLELGPGLYQLWATSYLPEEIGAYTLGLDTVAAGAVEAGSLAPVLKGPAPRTLFTLDLEALLRGTPSDRLPWVAEGPRGPPPADHRASKGQEGAYMPPGWQDR